MRSNAPKMNPTSAKILQENGDREGPTRLTRPIGTVKKKTLDTIEKPTFQPAISRKSRQLFEDAHSTYYPEDPPYPPDEEDDNSSWHTSSDGHGPQRVYERSQKWLQEKQLRMLREKAAREEEELRGCTFKPKVKATPREDRFDYPIDEDGYAYSSSNGGSIADRQAEWQRNRLINRWNYLLCWLFCFSFSYANIFVVMALAPSGI